MNFKCQTDIIASPLNTLQCSSGQSLFCRTFLTFTHIFVWPSLKGYILWASFTSKCILLNATSLQLFCNCFNTLFNSTHQILVTCYYKVNTDKVNLHRDCVWPSPNSEGQIMWHVTVRWQHMTQSPWGQGQGQLWCQGHSHCTSRSRTPVGPSPRLPS